MPPSTACPGVSVCIPTRNRADDLARRLSELSAQTWDDHEVVIVDDGSGDHTRDVVLAAAEGDPRVRYVALHPPAGIPRVVNRCLVEARGELVAFFHDHDSYAPNAVEKLAQALLDAPDAGFAFCGIVMVDATTGTHVATIVEQTGFGRRYDVLDRFVRSGTCAVAGSAVMVRPSLLPETPFPPELGAFADVGLWCALSAAGPTPYVAEPLATVQCWTERDTVAKLNWAAIGELADLRRKYVAVVRHDRRQRVRQRLEIAIQTARARAVFLARVVRLGIRAQPIPELSAAGGPRPVAALVAVAQLLARRRIER